MKLPTLFGPACTVFATLGSLAVSGAPVLPREPYAPAHVQLMARAESKGQAAQVADVDVWASGAQLRAELHGTSKQLWVGGLMADAVVVDGGKVEEPARGSVEYALRFALRPAPSRLANSRGDRVAGKPCRVMEEKVAGGLTLSRCIWRGLPLSISLVGRGLNFSAAAMIVEEDQVTVADLQPPPGAPLTPPSMSATR